MQSRISKAATEAGLTGFAIGLGLAITTTITLGDEQPADQLPIEFEDENVLTDGAVYRIIGAEPKKDICLVRVEKQMQERIDQYDLVDTEAVILLPNSEYPVAVEDFWHGNVSKFTCEPYDDLTVK